MPQKKGNYQREQISLQFSLRFTYSEASGWNAVNAELLQSCPTLCEPVDYSLSRGFSRREYWVGCHALLRGIFPTQGLNHVSYVSCISRGLFPTSATWEGPEGWGPGYTGEHVPSQQAVAAEGCAPVWPIHQISKRIQASLCKNALTL